MQVAPQEVRTFFVTVVTWGRRSIFHVHALAELFLDTLQRYREQKRFLLHEFVLMPDHFHLLITPMPEVSLEKAVQYIKGGFSFRVKRENGYTGEVWQRGFSDHRVHDADSFANHRVYIAENPVKAGLAASPDEFPWCFRSLARQKAQSQTPSRSEKVLRG